MKTCIKCGALFDGRYCRACAKILGAKYRAANRDKLKLHCATYYIVNQEKIKAKTAAWRDKNPEHNKTFSAKWRAENQGYQAAYRVANQIHIKAYESAYCDANRGKINARAAVYGAANWDKIREKNAAWREANPGYGKAYSIANPGKRRIRDQNRRARKLENGGVLSKGLDEKLFKLQKGKCPCCNLPLGNDYHLDHRMPLVRGGANEDWNMQLLRKICNLQKNAKHPVDFMRQRGFLL